MTPLPPEVARVSFSVLDGGAVVTELGKNTATFREALYAWADDNGATKDGRMLSRKVGSLLARARRG